MHFDRISHDADSAQPKPLTIDDFVIEPHSQRNAAPQARLLLSESGEQLRRGLQATKDAGGIPDETAMNLFHAAMQKAETRIDDSRKFLTDNKPLVERYISANITLRDLKGNMMPDDQAAFENTMTAYFKNLVPKESMENVLRKKYGDDATEAMRTMHEMRNSPVGQKIIATIAQGSEMSRDDELATQTLAAAKHSR